MLLDLLLPAVAGLQLDNVTADAQRIDLFTRSTAVSTRCPCCQQYSQRIHSRYTRQIADVPWAGIGVRMHLQVRRFFCDHTACARRIFCERLGLSIVAYARRTDRLNRPLTQVAFHLGGEAGTRLVRHLGMQTSPDTLLRLMIQTPIPAYPTPRVLGVDDWAQRKGKTYGTILVDLEQHRPVDLLPDRTSETLARWLKAHPGVEIISRDRSTAYAEGARQGAPEARQVADRFHLLLNLGDRLQRLLKGHSIALQEVATQSAVTLSIGKETEASSAAKANLSQILKPVVDGTTENKQDPCNVVAPTADKLLQPSYKQHRFDQVKALQQKGWRQRAIARHLHMGRRTVGDYMAANTLPRRAVRAPASTKVTPYWPYILQRWEDGCHNGVQLFAELQKQGFTGSYSGLRRAMSKYLPVPANEGTQPVSPPPAPLSPRRAAWLLMQSADRLAPEQKRTQGHLLAVSKTIAQVGALAQTFAQMVRKRKAELLDIWLAYACTSPITEVRTFATHLKQDYDAVKAALSLPWSNGQVEGQIHRLKLIKRQMYGRAHFDLLRKRVLYASG